MLTEDQLDEILAGLSEDERRRVVGEVIGEFFGTPPADDSVSAPPADLAPHFTAKPWRIGHAHPENPDWYKSDDANLPDNFTRGWKSRWREKYPDVPPVSCSTDWGRGGYVCTRERGHSGWHAAGAGYSIVAMWPVAEGVVA